MPGRLLMLQCADINRHTSVNRGLSSLAFFDDIRKGYQPQEPKLLPVDVPRSSLLKHDDSQTDITRNQLKPIPIRNLL
jgi:hypothetical protein